MNFPWNIRYLILLVFLSLPFQAAIAEGSKLQDSESPFHATEAGSEEAQEKNSLDKQNTPARACTASCRVWKNHKKKLVVAFSLLAVATAGIIIAIKHNSDPSGDPLNPSNDPSSDPLKPSFGNEELMLMKKVKSPDLRLGDNEDILLKALMQESSRASGVYSISPKHHSLNGHLRDMSDKELELLCNSLGAKVGQKINFFKYKSPNGNRIHSFIGFEYRRIDYIRDQESGNNHIVNLINAGVYD